MPKNVPSLRPQVTQLETRLTPAQAMPRVMLDSAGLLSVAGTAHTDLVRVWRDGSQVVVTLGRQGTEQRFAAAQVRRGEVRGGAGTDVCFNETAVAAVLDGGAGNDTLRGGEGDDFLVGGPGRVARNLLLGEGGVDAFWSVSRRDVIDPGPQTPPPPPVAFTVDQVAQ